MYFNNCGNSSINKTFIIEPQSVTGDTPTLSACTTMYTNLLESCSGDTTIQLGTGVVTFNSSVDGVDGFSANTIEASSYYSGGTNLLEVFSGFATDTYVTGGTFSDVGDSLNLVRNDGANVIITGITNFFTTGGTYNNTTGLIYFDRTDALSAYTIDLNALDLNDTFVSGGTYDSVTDIITLTRNDAGTVQITGITDTFTTGATLFGSTVYFNTNDSLSAYTADLSALDVNDTFVSGVTLSGNVLTLERNDGVDLDVNLDEIVFSGGSGNCITDLYVTNIYGCSPITFYNNLVMNTGTTITSLSGDSKITIDDNGVTIQYGAFGVDTVPIITLNSVGTAMSLFNSTFTKFGQIAIYDNDNGDMNTGGASQYPTALSSGNSTLKQNVINTNILGGLNISARTDNTAYLNQLGYNYGGAFETIISAATPTVDRIQTHQDASGVIALLSDLGSVSADTFVTSFNYDNNNNFTVTRNDGTAFTANVSVMSGLTVEGSLSAITFSATTLYGDGSNLTNTLHTTGGTYDSITDTITITNSTGGTYSITGVTDTFITGQTFNTGNYQLTTTLNDASNFVTDLSILSTDMVVTGGTYDINTGIVTFTNNSGGTFNVSGFTTGMTDSFTTTAVTVGNEIQFASNLYGANYYNVDLTTLLDTKTDVTLFNSHTADTSNPHQTTFSALTSTAHTHTISDVINLQTELNTKALQVDLVTHSGDTSNPHNVTIEQVSGVSETLFNTYTGDTATALLTKVEGANNVGSGAGNIFRDKTGTTLNFRTLSGGTNTTVTTVGDVNVIDVTLPPDANTFTTGTTVVGPTLYFDRNDSLSAYTADLSSFLDNTNYYATGGTYNAGTESIDFSGNNIDANFTVDVSALIDDTNTFITGFTYDNANTLTIIRNDLAAFSVTINTVTGLTVDGSLSAVTVSATTFYGDGSNLTGISTQDTYSTGGTFTNNELLITNSTGGTFSTIIEEFTGITVNGLISGDSISINGGEVMTRIPDSRDFQLFGNQSSTGIIDYGGVSGNTLDNTKFDVGPMKGWIVDNTTNPVIPVVTYVDYSGSTGSNPSGITLTYLATNPVTYIGLSGSATGDIVQSITPFSPDEHRDFLELGVIIHSDNTIVNVTNNLPAIGIDPTGQLYDIMHGLGYFNLGNGDGGNKYSANGSNLNIDKAGGQIFAHGSNYTNDPKNPHIKTLLSGSSLTFRYRISDSTEWANTTEVNPNIYELGGTTAATPTNKFTVQRVVVFPSNITRLQYGQTVYDSLSDAEASLSTESFIIESNINQNALLRGFIIVREGTTDLTNTNFAKFIEANYFGHAEETVVGNVHRTEILNHGSTGLRDGGDITADSATTFKVSAGTGLIIDNATNPSNPVLSDIVWSDITGQTITNLTGDVATVIMIDSNENIVQFPLQSPPSQSDKRDKILLGVVAHSDKATITNFYNGPIHIISPVNQHEDLTSSIGTFSINGNFVAGVTGTIELEKTAGTSFYYGGNYQTDKTNPSVLNTPVLSGSSTPANPLVYATGTEVLGLSGYSINTDNYDPAGAGTVIGLGVNKFTAHRIWHLPINNLLVFQYGQVEYNSLTLAIDGFGSENFVEPPGLNLGAYLISVIVTKEGNTDLSDTSEVKFIQQGKFAGVGGGGGSVADTLQSAYLNSTSPEILTDSTRTAVDFRVGSGADSDNVVTFQENSGLINAFVTGEGLISGQTIDGLTINEGGTNINTIYNTITNFDSHTGDTSNPHNVTIEQLSGTTGVIFNSHTGDTSIHYVKSSINLSELGSSAHTHPISEVVDLQSTLNSKVNTYTTGGTYNQSTDIIIFTNSTGGTYNVTGVTDTFITGQTFNTGNYQLTTILNDNSSFISDLSILSTDMVVTGGTYDINTGVVLFTNNSGGTFNVSGFTTGMTDSFTTTAVTVGNEIQFASNLYGSNFYNVDLTTLLDAKTDVSLFDTYTGDTATELSSKALQTDFVTHSGDTSNPHNVTIEQLSGTSATLFNTYTGDTATELSSKALQTDFVTHSGDTSIHFTKESLNSDFVNASGDTMTGNLTVPVLSATTISGDTFYGDGSNLTGISAQDTFSTGGTFTNNTLLITNNTGGTFNTVIDTFTGLTVDGSLSATTISATTFYGDGSNLTGISGGGANLSIGTITSTELDIDSDTGTNATLSAATATEAGLLTSAKRAEIIANNSKVTNVSTNLSTTQTSTTVDVVSSDGTDATLPQVISGGNAGVMSGADKAKLNGIETSADVTDATNVAAAGAVMDSEGLVEDTAFASNSAREYNVLTQAEYDGITPDSTTLYFII